MAACKRPRGLRTRRAILRKAVNIASVEGLEGLTIGRLASVLRISKSGLFAPLPNDNTVRSYTINATTGALTLVDGPVPADITPDSVAIDPSSRFAYVANINSSDVWAYKINQSTGA